MSDADLPSEDELEPEQTAKEEVIDEQPSEEEMKKMAVKELGEKFKTTVDKAIALFKSGKELLATYE